jgi:thiol-disulfide isomerase/thioredoxin
MNRTAVLLVLVAAIGAGAGWLIGSLVKRPSLPAAPAAATARPAITVETSLPDLALPQVGGGTRDLSGFRGRPVLINWWATWCPPCLKEMPLLDAFARRQGEGGIAVVGIALDDPQKVAEYLQRVPVAYPNLIEAPGPGDSSVRLGNTRAVLPYSILADAEGRVVATHRGAFDEESLQRWVDGALGP